MTALPPSITPDDEIGVTWERDDDGVRVVAVLGDASVTVECAYGDQEIVPWLVAALPSILEAAWDAIEQAENPSTDEEPK